MRLKNCVCQDLPGPNASQTTDLAFVLPASETEKQLLPGARGRHGHTQLSAASCAPGQGVVPGLRILCMNALFLNHVRRSPTVPQRLTRRVESQIAQLDGLILYKRGYLVWGPYFIQSFVGVTIGPCQSRRNNSFEFLPQQLSPPSSLVPRRQVGGGVRRCEYEYLCSLTF